MSDQFEDQLAAIMRRQISHATASLTVDRRGWTRKQWVDDAKRLMGDIDGAVTVLVNGHIKAMLATIAELEDTE